MCRSYQGICPICGEAFLSGYPYRIYCSPECRQEAASERMRSRQPLPPARALRPAVDPTREAAAAIGGMEVRAWNGVPIHRRPDGWVNATAMAQACGKRWNDYIRLDRTHEYITALREALAAENHCGATVAGNPATLPEVIEVRRGGDPATQGTYIHPRLAIDFSRWLRAAFAVWMDGWFLETLTGRPAAPTTTPPTTPGITVTARTEREAMGLWHAAIEAEVARALRLTLGTAGTTDAGLRVMTRGPWRYVAC